MAVIRPFVVGFATTLKYLFRKPITINYPEEKMPMFPKWRGKQVLMRDENGLGASWVIRMSTSRSCLHASTSSRTK